MTSYVPVIKNGAGGAILYVALAPQTATGAFQTNPTLASGDVKISLDGGAFANLNTLPAVTPSGGKAVKVTLSQAETNADNIAILFSDAAGAEWCDKLIQIQTAAKQFDDLAIQSDLTSVKTKTDSLTFTVAGMVDSNVVDWKGATAPAMTGDAYARIGAAGAGLTALGDTRIAHLDADVSSRMATFIYTAPLDAAGTRTAVGLASANLDTQLSTIAGYIDTEVAAIKAKTDNLPSDPADASDIAAAFSSLQTHGDSTWSTADVSDLPTNAELATALAGADDATLAAIAALNNLSAAEVKTQADQALTDAGVTTTVTSRIDAAISSRLASGAYTAPDNATIATIDGKATTILAGVVAIDGKTTNLPSDPADQSLLIAASGAILAVLGNPSGASLSADVAAVKGDTAAIQANTDQLVFTGGALDSNIAKVNGVTVTGNGTTGNEWGPT